MAIQEIKADMTLEEMVAILNSNFLFWGNRFNSEGKALEAVHADTADKSEDSKKLGGMLAANYVQKSSVSVQLLNGFKTDSGASSITIHKHGNIVIIDASLTNTAGSNDRPMFVIPAGYRPQHTVDYKHFNMLGHSWIRTSTGEFMAQGAVKDAQIYVVYIATQ